MFRVERRRRILPVAVFYHISSAPSFVEHIASIARLVLRRFAAVLLITGERLLHGAPLPRLALHTPTLHSVFASQDLRPEQVDGLYSEMVLFDVWGGSADSGHAETATE